MPRSGVQLVHLTPVRQCASGRSGKPDHSEWAAHSFPLSFNFHPHPLELVGLVPSPGIEQGGRLKVGQVKLTNSCRCSANAFPQFTHKQPTVPSTWTEDHSTTGPFPHATYTIRLHIPSIFGSDPTANAARCLQHIRTKRIASRSKLETSNNSQQKHPALCTQKHR